MQLKKNYRRVQYLSYNFTDATSVLSSIIIIFSDKTKQWKK